MSAIEQAPLTREAETRARIVATAERLFREIGFQKTTVADIARELRMSPANVYRFFGSKADIHIAVARQLMGEVEAAVPLAPHGGAPQLFVQEGQVRSAGAGRQVAEHVVHDGTRNAPLRVV